MSDAMIVDLGAKALFALILIFVGACIFPVFVSGVFSLIFLIVQIIWIPFEFIFALIFPINIRSTGNAHYSFAVRDSGVQYAVNGRWNPHVYTTAEILKKIEYPHHPGRDEEFALFTKMNQINYDNREFLNDPDFQFERRHDEILNNYKRRH